MLGSRISDMLDQELSQLQQQGPATDESRQKQLLQEDEEEDFLDEGRMNHRTTIHYHKVTQNKVQNNFPYQ